MAVKSHAVETPRLIFNLHNAERTAYCHLPTAY